MARKRGCKYGAKKNGRCPSRKKPLGLVLCIKDVPAAGISCSIFTRLFSFYSFVPTTYTSEIRMYVLMLLNRIVKWSNNYC
jgi:hypothetical protein